jgi:hypothetical protein
MRKNNKTKMCPFLDQNCLKLGCQIYNEILDQCNINIVAYNLYRLGEVVRQFLEKLPDTE